MATDNALVTLNVGGVEFTTSKQTLTWIPDSFFSSLLSGRIPTLRDAKGAIFIDRDPDVFKVILNYLRTKQITLKNVDTVALMHDAEFFGLGPLVKRLMLCGELDSCACGDVLFHGYLSAPPFPQADTTNVTATTQNARAMTHARNFSDPQGTSAAKKTFLNCSSFDPSLALPPLLSQSPGPSNRANDRMEVISTNPALCSSNPPVSHRFDTNSSFADNDWRFQLNSEPAYKRFHSRAASVDVKPVRGHRRAGSDIARQIRQEFAMAKQGVNDNPYRVHLIRGHHNWIAVSYNRFISCYRMKESIGWHLTWVSALTETSVSHIALNAKPGSQSDKMLAAALTNNSIHLWALNEEGGDSKIGVFSLFVSVDTLFFIGSQLVALSQTGKVGIWHSMTQNWQVQDVLAISSYDTAGSFLLLGCTNGSIHYIDMQKFPLRMKDNDLLVTELYRDPHGEVITSISVYLTPKTSLCGNWIEIAYGTSGGAVRVIVQHPETVGHGPQLFQTYNVHRAPITRVALTTNHLISVCSEYNHVRSFVVTRFRGMISTQPGSTPCASFKIMTLESADNCFDTDSSDVGPFGEQDSEQQVFIQKIVPETNQLFVRLASNGERVCVIKSVDGSSITAFLVHECEGSNRMGSRPRRYLFTGHSNGSIQMWDLTTALDFYQTNKEKGLANFPQGPSAEELLQMIDDCEVTCNSLSPTPSMTPAVSMVHLPQGSFITHSTEGSTSTF